MKIDVHSGLITFVRGSLQPKQDREHFLVSPLGSVSIEEYVNEDWRHYKVDSGSGVIATIFFKGDRLDRVFLQMPIPSDLEHEWTESLELERKAKHDSWLRSELGEPPYNYSWGSVTSDYDPRGCVSDIIIAYAT